MMEKKFDKPTINSSAIRDHLSECLRLKHDMTKWDGMDEAELRTQMFLSLFEVRYLFFLFSLFFFFTDCILFFIGWLRASEN